MKFENKISIKSWTLMMFMCFPAFYSLLKQVIGSASIAHVFLILLTYIPLLYIFLARHEPVYKIYVYLIISLAVVFSFYGMINIQNDFMMESYALPSFLSLFGGGIAFFFMAIQDRYSSVKRVLKIITIIQFVYYVYYSLNIESYSTYQWGYDMFLGYKMLLPCLLSLNFALSINKSKEKVKVLERFFWFVIFGYAVYVILSYGSRGPFVGIFCYFVMKYGTEFLPNKKISVAKKFCVSALVVFLFAAFLIEFDKILMAINYVFDGLNISSRTIERLMMGTVTDDNGRSSLFSEALRMVNVVGHGPFSDQFYFGEGNYCHNFVIEILFDFGMILGVLILACVVWQVSFIIKNSTKSDWYELFSVFFCYCFARLMFSGTFWSETNFWILLAIGVLCIRDIQKYPSRLEVVDFE